SLLQTYQGKGCLPDGAGSEAGDPQRGARLWSALAHSDVEGNVNMATVGRVRQARVARRKQQVVRHVAICWCVGVRRLERRRVESRCMECGRVVARVVGKPTGAG